MVPRIPEMGDPDLAIAESDLRQDFFMRVYIYVPEAYPYRGGRDHPSLVVVVP